MIEFKIDGAEFEALTKWLARRPKKKAYGGAIGGRYTYTFTPTGVGTVVKVTDALTNTTKDLTEYGDW